MMTENLSLSDAIMSNNIETMDTTEKFILEHFKTCDDQSDEHIKDCRGIIRRIDNKNIVCKTYPFTPEYDINCSDIEQKVEYMVQNGAKFYPSFEGTVLRLWFYEGVWYLSTHKKIDADQSRWGSNLTFKYRFTTALTLYYGANLEFQNAIDNLPEPDNDIFINFTRLLDTKYIYTFLLRTSVKTRIVCNYHTEDLFFVGGFTTDSFTFVEPTNIHSYLPLVPEIAINSFDEYKNVVQTNIMQVVNPSLTQGIIAVLPDGKATKLLNPEYLFWYKVRDNEPILVQAYINKIKKGNQDDIRTFLSLYASNTEFQEFEHILVEVKRNLLSNYIRRYIHKKVVAVPPEQHKVLSNLYNMYLKDKKNNPLSSEWISEKVNNLSTLEIYNLYKQYKYRHEKFGNGNTVNEDIANKTKQAYYKSTPKVEQSEETMN